MMTRYHPFLLVLMILPVFILAGHKGLHKKSAVIQADRHLVMIDHMINSEMGTQTESVLPENSMNPDKTLSPLAGVIRVPTDYAGIQAAIDAAVNGDTVLVADSTYYENINFKGKAITVASYFYVDGDTNHINNTIINGSQPSDPNKGSVASFTSGEDTTSVLCGFTITGGTGTISEDSRVGGGVYCYSSGARIIHNKIINNTVTHNSPRGGGIGTFPFGNNNFSVIEDNTISSNTCTGIARGQGGGIYMPQGKINHNIIRDNLCRAGKDGYALGGGIHAASDQGVQRTLSITNNQIEHNRSLNFVSFGRGGGVEAWGGVVVYLINNVIKYNQVVTFAGGMGGGIDFVYSKEPSVIKNNTIAFNSSRFGGGVSNYESNGILIEGNDFIDNEADTSGGAIFSQLSTLTVTGNDLRNNQAKYGGAIFDYSGNYQIIDNNFIENQSKGWGGAINSQSSTGGNITGNEFVNNLADSSGGGCYLHGSNLTLTNNRFRANTAKYGGAVLDYLGNYQITNNIFTENEAQHGGAIFNIDQPDQDHLVQIINNTLTGNVADTAGALACENAKVILMNTICWGNTAVHGPEIEMRGGTLNAAYSDIQFGQGGIVIDSAATVNWLEGNIVTDPLFADADYRLSEKSYCLGNGKQSMNIYGQIYTAPETDYEGNIRPNPPASNPDIGAWESPYDKPGNLRLVPESYATIQSAIDAAVDGEVVLVADSTYYENINFKGKAITVASYYFVNGDTNYINTTIINGSQPSNPDSGSVVYFVSGEDTTSILCGFSITEGTGTETSNIWEGTEYPCRAGGGILFYNSGAHILNNKIIRNTVYSSAKRVYGGGLAALTFESTAYVILENNQILYNTITADQETVWGGGVEIFCNTRLVNNIISYNSVTYNGTSRYHVQEEWIVSPCNRIAQQLLSKPIK